jgi:antitoxin MazE
MIVSKWGNSLAVRLPKALVEQLGLKEGDELDVVASEAGKLIVAKDDDAEQRRQIALKRMSERAWELPADFTFDREEANKR